jgi:hypothetical protein
MDSKRVIKHQFRAWCLICFFSIFFFFFFFFAVVFAINLLLGSHHSSIHFFLKNISTQEKRKKKFESMTFSLNSYKPFFFIYIYIYILPKLLIILIVNYLKTGKQPIKLLTKKIEKQKVQFFFLIKYIKNNHIF